MYVAQRWTTGRAITAALKVRSAVIESAEECPGECIYIEVE
jgi:hypothetical protein